MQITPEELRDLYVRATLRQRYSIALSRIENPDLGPSLLVNVVSALEGFARAVAVRQLVQDGEPLDEAYARLRLTGLVSLIGDHICPRFKTTPDTALGSDTWVKLPEAVAFRNLLIHEAAFLNGETCDSLIDASRRVLDRLAEMSGAREVQ